MGRDDENVFYFRDDENVLGSVLCGDDKGVYNRQILLSGTFKRCACCYI